MPQYCYKCPACQQKTERYLSIAARNNAQHCIECGHLLERDKATELRGSSPARPTINLPKQYEKPMSERVRSGEFQLAKHFDEIGGPKIFE